MPLTQLICVLFTLQDNVNLQFQSGLKVYGDRVWTVSNRLQNYIVDQVAQDEINIRINVGTVSQLVKNTKCDRRNDDNHMDHLKLASKFISGFNKFG